ncbi:Auxin-responsive protein IAA25 [Platanthera guangdongensis]|uniref:Auxin-responsive protein n=1 Tax=Platanthera guangdongensis TaxID=2320717 RepID=A0ABR2MQJ3_9ASPA
MHVPVPLPPRETQPPAPPSVAAVGWPPVCSFRRNMVSSQAGRPEAEDERKAKRAKIGEEEAFNGCDLEAKGAMFVKVNMEGYAVGRKIDLSSHVSYDSLSDSLRKLFLNFLSLDGSEEYKVGTPNHDFLLLYEDNEGDRMLVGDVPWQMFVTSVKRLYIVRSPKPKRMKKLVSPHMRTWILRSR